MSYKQESVDTLDLERFVDLDQLSPGSSSKGKQILRAPDMLSSQSQQQLQQQQNAQMFSGPSHQYDQFPQQTGLPSGGFANALAANRNTAFNLGGYSNTYGSGSGIDFDFNAVMPQPFESSGDMDLDFNNIDGYIDTESGFVNPNVLGGNDDASPPPARAEIVRMWPGMHTRQAELAKQQQQQEIQRQQQIKSSQQQQPQAQAQVQSQGHRRSGSKASNGANKATDPIVEERISRLLNQMRHSSVSSSNEDNSQGQSSQGQSQSNGQLSRSKKDEEEMDEDERLLASEEGKKLSSKERRQLRNKVSARAFRSRRKEYISQLEGEISLKSQENDELLAENEALKAENSRLTDLSKMLLSSPAFNNFLNDLSASGLAGLPSNLMQPAAPQNVPSQPRQRQSAPKDVNPSQQQQQLQLQGNQDGPQIGMAMIPENNMNFMAANVGGNWNTGMDFNFNEPQVYAVTELPTPVLDVDALSGKVRESSVSSFEEAKSDMPLIETAPGKFDAPEAEARVGESQESAVAATPVEEDPRFPLFCSQAAAKPASAAPEYEVFGEIAFDKAVARFDMVIEGEEESREVSAAVMARFEALCSSLDAASTRLDGLVSRL